MPSRSIFLVLREVDGLACSLPSLEDTGSSTPCQLPVLICFVQTLKDCMNYHHPVAAQVEMSFWTLLDLRAGPDHPVPRDPKALC